MRRAKHPCKLPLLLRWLLLLLLLLILMRRLWTLTPRPLLRCAYLPFLALRCALSHLIAVLTLKGADFNSEWSGRHNLWRRKG